MGIVKDMFIQAHEELVEKYLEEHPEATWDEAYDKCADGAYDRMRDNFADRADQVKQRMKDEGKW